MCNLAAYTGVAEPHQFYAAPAPCKNVDAFPAPAAPALALALANTLYTSLYHLYAAPAPGKNFVEAPAAPDSTCLYSKAKFLKRTKV
jgi:hypothetical protein